VRPLRALGLTTYWLQARPVVPTCAKRSATAQGEGGDGPQEQFTRGLAGWGSFTRARMVLRSSWVSRGLRPEPGLMPRPSSPRSLKARNRWRTVSGWQRPDRAHVSWRHHRGRLLRPTGRFMCAPHVGSMGSRGSVFISAESIYFCAGNKHFQN